MDMAIVMPDEGEVLFMGWAINNVTQQDLTLDLYINDYTPVAASTKSNFTITPIAEGLANKTLTKGNWSVATVANVTTATYGSQLSWTFTGDTNTIYGYVVYYGTTCLWAEKFAAAESTYDGKVIKLTPALVLNGGGV